MIRTKLSLSICAPALILIACASTTPESRLSQQGVNTQDAKALPVADENTAILMIDRGDLGTAGYIRNARVLVNGEDVGNINKKQYLRVSVPPGAYEVELKIDPISNNKGGSFKLEAHAGQTYNYHLATLTNRATSGLIGFGANNSYQLNVVRFVANSENKAQ